MMKTGPILDEQRSPRVNTPDQAVLGHSNIRHRRQPKEPPFVSPNNLNPPTGPCAGV
jgi:hypothetical protein